MVIQELCKCDHALIDHNMYSITQECLYDSTSIYAPICPCNKYTPDNLKLLEQKYEEKQNE